jgi:hypothetical protein
MKKLVATAAVAAMLGSAAFADVSVGAWGKAVTGIGNATNGKGDGTDVQISNMQAWGDNGPRNGITFSGDHDGTIGFTAQAFWNGYSGVDVGDAAYLWYQPLEQLKVWVGKDNCGNPLRGDACYGMWDIKRVGTMDGGYHEGWTFMGQACDGAAIGVFPIEGLSFYASLGYPVQGSKAKDPRDGNYNSNLANVLGRQAKYSLAYDIEGVGAVKLGLEEKGKVVEKTTEDGKEYKDQNIISASFELKAVENLTFNVGAFIPMVQYKASDSEWVETQYYDNDSQSWEFDKSSNFNRINAYVKYGAAEGLNLHAQFGVKLNCPDLKDDATSDYGIKAKDGQLGFLVAGGVDYKIMDDLTLYANAGYANGIYKSLSSEDHSDVLDFGIGVTKDYGEGCSVSAGFVGATNGVGMYDATYTDGEKKYPFSWGIPLVITYSF